MITRLQMGLFFLFISYCFGKNLFNALYKSGEKLYQKPPSSGYVRNSAPSPCDWGNLKTPTLYTLNTKGEKITKIDFAIFMGKLWNIALSE